MKCFAQRYAALSRTRIAIASIIAASSIIRMSEAVNMVVSWVWFIVVYVSSEHTSRMNLQKHALFYFCNMAFLRSYSQNKFLMVLFLFFLLQWVINILKANKIKDILRACVYSRKDPRNEIWFMLILEIKIDWILTILSLIIASAEYSARFGFVYLLYVTSEMAKL